MNLSDASSDKINLSSGGSVSFDSVRMVENRVLWIDIAKGILILLMVVGHSTGMFNNIIYQFHIGAFFVLSGYVNNFEKRGAVQTIINKFIALILPVITMTIIIWLMNYCFVKAGIYDYLYSEGTDFQKLNVILKKLVTKGEIWTWWLGACWFLIELFLISIFSKIVYEIFCRSVDWLFLFSLLVLWVSYTNTNLFFFSLFSFSKMFALSFCLFSCGAYIRTIGIFASDKIQKNWKWLFVYLIAGFFAFRYFAGKHFVIDMANGTFNRWYEDLACVFNGFLVTVAVSLLLSKIKFLNGVFSYLGKNTISIILFHFAYFKVAFVLLALFGVVDYLYLRNFVPTSDIGSKYWWMISSVAILLSVATWKLINISDATKLFFGKNIAFNNYINSKIKRFELWNYYDEKVKRLGAYLKDNVLMEFNRKMLFFILMFILFILVFYPLLGKGIILNDELQDLQNRNFSFKYLLSSLYGNSFEQGRIYLNLTGSFFRSLESVSKNYLVNGFIQLILIFITFTLFAVLCFRLSKNYFISVLFLFCSVLFLPVTFEHAVPNAFNTLVLIPLAILCVSLICYHNYLISGRRIYVILSLVLYVISLFGYEYMLMFLPLFFMVHYYVLGFRKLYSLLLFIALFIIWFIIFYVQSRLITQGYDGVVLSANSLKGPYDIISMLFKSSLPGYYLTNRKYRYLMDVYDIGVSHLRLFPLIIVMMLTLVHIVQKFLIREQKSLQITAKDVLLVLCVLGYTFIPAVPNSVAKLYQGQVTSRFFTSLPVSASLHIFQCLFLSIAVYIICRSIRNKVLITLVFLCLSYVAVSTQYNNDVVYSRHRDNFNRLMFMKGLYETDLFKHLSNSKIYSHDLFKTNDLLAIHGDFFNKIAAGNRIFNLVTENSDCSYQNGLCLNEFGSQLWGISSSRELILLSSHLLGDSAVVDLPFRGGTKFLLGNHSFDKGYYLYCVSLNTEDFGAAKNVNECFEKKLFVDSYPYKVSFKDDISSFFNGISEIDSFGRWINSDKLESKFNIAGNLSESDSGILIRFNFVAVNQSEQNPVIIIKPFINGSPMESQEFHIGNNSGNFTVKIPKEYLVYNLDKNNLSISFEGVKSPASMGLNEDIRLLSFAVSDVVFNKY